MRLLEQLSDELSELIERIVPGVIGLFATSKDLSEGAGSGFLLDSDGHAVTNQPCCRRVRRAFHGQYP